MGSRGGGGVWADGFALEGHGWARQDGQRVAHTRGERAATVCLMVRRSERGMQRGGVQRVLWRDALSGRRRGTAAHAG